MPAVPGLGRSEQSQQHGVAPALLRWLGGGGGGRGCSGLCSERQLQEVSWERQGGNLRLKSKCRSFSTCPALGASQLSRERCPGAAPCSCPLVPVSGTHATATPAPLALDVLDADVGFAAPGRVLFIFRRVFSIPVRRRMVCGAGQGWLPRGGHTGCFSCPCFRKAARPLKYLVVSNVTSRALS